MVRTRQPNINRAKEAVKDELTLLKRERDAFTQFLSRLDTIETCSQKLTNSMGGGTMVRIERQTGVSDRLRQVRMAYRETVMDVPHYDMEYGDTLQGSLEMEFSDSLASQLIDGEFLTPALYDALLDGSKRARDNRDEFIQSLSKERDSLQDIATELNEIESQSVELSDQIAVASHSEQLTQIDDSLVTLRDQCTDLANRRQIMIHNRSAPILSGADKKSLMRYLYDDLETMTPALSDIAACLDTIRHQRRRCLK